MGGGGGGGGGTLLHSTVNWMHADLGGLEACPQDSFLAGSEIGFGHL